MKLPVNVIHMGMFAVQVMALLAYLYEFKQNYGPHLIIVPNAVMVNWKAELQTWLPDFRCVYYTGSKDERALKFQQVRHVLWCAASTHQ